MTSPGFSRRRFLARAMAAIATPGLARAGTLVLGAALALLLAVAYAAAAAASVSAEDAPDKLAPPGPDATAARRRELAAGAPGGFRLIAYLDAGVQNQDPHARGVVLRQVRGAPFQWPGADAVDDRSASTVAVDSDRVEFAITGLSPRHRYTLGVRWWDYDNRQRRQSLTITGGKPERTTVLIPSRRLPDHAHARKLSETLSAAIPAPLVETGRCRIAIHRDAAANAVVSEIWFHESAAAAPPRPARAAAPKKRAVIITGIDYPGHKWKETTPVLVGLLMKQPGLEVRVEKDPAYLASPGLLEFDVAILHFMNWKTPDPGPAARENLRRFVAGGKGLVLVHFACGAFQDWPEFANLAGRVWDPELRGHDPRGSFRVHFTADGKRHAATAGLHDFETDDELYTCLDGDREIMILATATSKVDGKNYPMAFALPYEKGRVFHSPLGHDVRALLKPGVQALFRRGAMWAAGDSAPSED